MRAQHFTAPSYPGQSVWIPPQGPPVFDSLGMVLRAGERLRKSGERGTDQQVLDTPFLQVINEWLIYLAIVGASEPAQIRHGSPEEHGPTEPRNQRLITKQIIKAPILGVVSLQIFMKVSGHGAAADHEVPAILQIFLPGGLQWRVVIPDAPRVVRQDTKDDNPVHHESDNRNSLPSPAE